MDVKEKAEAVDIMSQKTPVEKSKVCCICGYYGGGLFPLPTIRKCGGTKQEIDELRLTKWLEAVRIEKYTQHIRVCAKHFLTGVPAHKDAYNDIDWIPHLNLDPKEHLIGSNGPTPENQDSVSTTLPSGQQTTQTTMRTAENALDTNKTSLRNGMVITTITDHQRQEIIKKWRDGYATTSFEQPVTATDCNMKDSDDGNKKRASKKGSDLTVIDTDKSKASFAQPILKTSCDARCKKDQRNRKALDEPFSDSVSMEYGEMSTNKPEAFSSLHCQYSECEEVRKKLVEDLQNSLCKGERLMAKIKFLESATNINLDLLQLALDTSQNPEVEEEFKKVIDLVQIVMKPQESRVLKEDKQTAYCNLVPKREENSRHQGDANFISPNLHSIRNDVSLSNINICNAKGISNNSNIISDENSNATPTSYSYIVSASHATTVSQGSANTPSQVHAITQCTTTLSQLHDTSQSDTNITSRIHDNRHIPILNAKTTLLQPHVISQIHSNITSPINTKIISQPNVNTSSPIHDKIIPSEQSLKCTTVWTKMLCDFCGTLFRCRSICSEKYELHMRQAHLGDVPLQCGKCGRKFNSKQNLKNHTTHCKNKERSIQCEKCGKTCKSGTNIKQNKAIYKTGGKTYINTHYKCKLLANLKSHARKHHQSSIKSNSINDGHKNTE